MAFVVKDRVKVSSTTTGTGTLTLGVAPSGFQDFSVIGNGNTTSYAIVDNNTGAWEVGIGTYTASGTLLSRDTVLESSTGGAKVSFAAGAKDVFVTYPAETSVTDLGVSRPTIRPSLLLDFANTEALDPRITFARASTARYYNGVTTAKAEENLLTYSQAMDDAAWTKSQLTVTANSAVAPDGTTTAETITEDATTNFHRIFGPTYASTSGLAYSFSVFAKKGTRNFVQIFVSTGFDPNNAYANFNIDTGSVGTVGSAATATITSVGNGWFRCTMTTTATSTSTSALVNFALITSGTAARAESYLGTNSTIFLWGAQVEQRSAVTAYTPTTTQPITNYVPVLQSAANNVARFDHNPITGESLGLLIEEQRTNLLLRSEEFDDAAWLKVASTITANTIVAPDGTLTGDKIVEDTAASAHGINAATAPTTTIGAVQTISIYAKKAERNFLQILFTTSHVTGNPRANYDLNTGTLGTVDSGISAQIVSVGNDWYRCVATVTAALTGLRPFFNLVTSSSAARNESYTGNGFSGIYIWGAQLEAGAFPTSYIPTVASQVTRSADAASMTGANFSSWYAGGQGTVYSESAVYAAAVKTQGVWDLLGGATSTSLRSPQSTDPRLRAFVGGTFSGFGAGPAITNNVFIKATVAWQGLSGRLQSGGTGVDVAAVANLDATQLLIGSLINSGSNSLNGTIKKLAFYPARLTNAELQGLTS